jgi:hypothetical protein
MNIDIEKTFAFSSVLVMPDLEPCINEYDVRLRMRVESPDSTEYNIAYMRIKHWFYEIMQGAVLIDHGDSRRQAWANTGMRCMDFPTEPFDQVLGMMLMSKLEAITQQRIIVLQTAITSSRDDYVYYVCDHGDGLHWFEKPGWWNDAGPVHCYPDKNKAKSGKVISLVRIQDWKQHDLDWDHAHNITGDLVKIENFERDVPDPVQ